MKNWLLDEIPVALGIYSNINVNNHDEHITIPPLTIGCSSVAIIIMTIIVNSDKLPTPQANKPETNIIIIFIGCMILATPWFAGH